MKINGGDMDRGQSMNFYEALQVLEPDDRPLAPGERIRAMTPPLFAWYESHARILPWRERPEPYRVWISEIMLQQTRVEAVKPYFQRFMEELPDVGALAAAEEERLLKLWQGLGYYNRARNLRRAAQVVMESFGGRLPKSCEELQTLPGIGSYTAGAIASIAYDVPVPAVDGNVLRLLARVLASGEDIGSQSAKRRMETLLRENMPKERAGAFNQGLIEIGAMVCVPNGQPKCGECPFFSLCLGRRRGLLDSIPYKAPKKPRKIEDRTVFLLEEGGRVAIEKRPDTGLLASLYQFPNVEGRLDAEGAGKVLESWGLLAKAIEPAGEARHVFSHVEWNMVGYRVLLEPGKTGSFLFAGRDEIREKYPVPNAFWAYLKVINGES